MGTQSSFMAYLPRLWQPSFTVFLDLVLLKQSEASVSYRNFWTKCRAALRSTQGAYGIDSVGIFLGFRREAQASQQMFLAGSLDPLMHSSSQKLLRAGLRYVNHATEMSELCLAT